jgi:FMN reductase
MKVIGIGGSLRSGSQSEYAVRVALLGAEEAGASTTLIAGEQLQLPFYDVAIADRTEAARRLVEEIRQADGLIVGSPGYHGGPSGLIKNALDYLEDLRDDERPYLTGRAVGLVAVAAGWQAAVGTLNQLRTTTHALRAWPTPLGLAINSRETKFDDTGGCNDTGVYDKLRLIGRQVATFNAD